MTAEIQAIESDINAYPLPQRSFVGKSLALFQNKSLFARMWRAFLLQFMAQMCGATAMKYYLPTLLKALGLSTRLALMAGAVEMTAKIGMTVVEMWIIDRIGRKACLAGGSAVMAIAMLVSHIRDDLPLHGALTVTDKRSFAQDISRQREPGRRCSLHCIYFHLCHGIQPRPWPSRLGLQFRSTCQDIYTSMAETY